MNQSYIRKLENINKSNLKGRSGLGTIDSAVEWLKWLSYETKGEQTKIKKIENKKAKDLSLDDLHFLTEYKERKEMIDLIKKYQEGKVTDEEYLKVYNYIYKSIDNIVFDKLTKEELEEVRHKTSLLPNMKKEDLKNMLDNYDNLSMVDSYMLHISLDFAFTNKLGKVNRKI